MGKPIRYTNCPMCGTGRACIQPRAKPTRKDILGGVFHYATTPMEEVSFARWMQSVGHGRPGMPSGFQTLRSMSFREVVEHSKVEPSLRAMVDEVVRRAMEIIKVYKEVNQ